MDNSSLPRLERVVEGEIALWTDPSATSRGVVFGFTERTGGVSLSPYASLNLGKHVGDDPLAVEENRRRMLAAMDLARHAERLTVAEQVHGSHLTVVGGTEAGAGSAGRPPVASTDAMLTAEPGIPLLMCFADCVPIVIIAPGPTVCVAHAGWRGALAGIAASAVRSLAESARCAPTQLTAYIGPHIGACHYETDERIMSQFVSAFGTFARAESGGLDLGAIVASNLTDAGVQSCHIASLERCTAEETDRFFSYRAEAGMTGRHGAVVCIAQ